jgi:hypothetical protein
MARVLDLEGVGVTEPLGWYEAIVASVHDVTAGGDVPEAGRAAFQSLHTAVTANMVDKCSPHRPRAVGRSVTNPCAIVTTGVGWAV